MRLADCILSDRLGGNRMRHYKGNELVYKLAHFAEIVNSATYIHNAPNRREMPERLSREEQVTLP